MTRLLGRFAPIFNFNCQHCKTKQKEVRGFQQKISWIFKIFKNLMKIEFWWRQIFENLIIHKPSLGSREIPQKIWTRSVQPFWRLLDTNRQTNRQTDKPNLYIDSENNVPFVFVIIKKWLFFLKIWKKCPHSKFFLNLHSLSKLKFTYNIFQYKLRFFSFSPFL